MQIHAGPLLSCMPTCWHLKRPPGNRALRILLTFRRHCTWFGYALLQTYTVIALKKNSQCPPRKRSMNTTASRLHGSRKSNSGGLFCQKTISRQSIKKSSRKKLFNLLQICVSGLQRARMSINCSEKLLQCWLLADNHRAQMSEAGEETAFSRR